MDDILGEPSYKVSNMDNDELALVFSGNINGETHPCGCRKYPLGGLPQVAGFFHELKKDKSMVYVDAGDTFFPSSFMPERLRDSLTFAATNLARALDELGLDFYVPGDQDFAGGIEFLQDVAKKYSYQFLIANLTQKDLLKHKKWNVIKKGPHRIFLTGVIEPELLATPYAQFFGNTETALKEVLKEIKERGFEKENPFHRFVVISHSGIERDEKLAQAIPEISWIVGAHSQSFTQRPRKVNDARLVQVLSRNHYMGEVSLSLKSDKSNDKFIIHEMRDSWVSKLTPNPFVNFIDKHKAEISRIQQEEQQTQITQTRQVQPYQTAQSCLECHTAQANKWMSTSHAMAYHTLMRVNEPYNMSCVECHALGTHEPQGFSTVDEMIVIDPDKLVESPSEKQEPIEDLDQSNENDLLKSLKESYWSEVREAFSDVGSLRELEPSKLKVLSQRWLDIDRVNGLTHSFANVQCLNCHAQHPDHPFHISDKPDPSYEEKALAMKKRCISCHNSDQSPEWYKKDEKGLSTGLNEEVFQTKKDSIACPSLEKESPQGP
jgi:hypothetical protein